jgi:hypothetical protein
MILRLCRPPNGAAGQGVSSALLGHGNHHASCSSALTWVPRCCLAVEVLEERTSVSENQTIRIVPKRRSTPRYDEATSEKSLCSWMVLQQPAQTSGSIWPWHWSQIKSQGSASEECRPSSVTGLTEAPQWGQFISFRAASRRSVRSGCCCRSRSSFSRSAWASRGSPARSNNTNAAKGLSKSASRNQVAGGRLSDDAAHPTREQKKSQMRVSKAKRTMGLITSYPRRDHTEEENVTARNVTKISVTVLNLVQTPVWERAFPKLRFGLQTNRLTFSRTAL